MGRGRLWCVYLVMKLLSWNVRGLGGAGKRREVSSLVREKKPFILCIQETKLPVFEASVCKSIWGDDNVDYSYQPSVGASGGIATLWDLKEVEVWSSVSLDHVLAVTGRFLKSEDQFVVFNVYAPCDISRQQVLWNVLSSRIDSLAGQNVCVCVVTSMLSVVRRKEEVLVVFFPRQASTASTTLLSTISWWTSRSGGALSRGTEEMGGR